MRTNPKNEVLALDPSIRAAGVALFRNRKLIGSGTIKLPANIAPNVPARCLRMAQEIVSWVVEREAAPAHLIVEWPKVSDQSIGKDKNSLFGLAGVVGAVSGQLSMTLASAVAGILSEGLAMQDETLNVVAYTPDEWSYGMEKAKTKGQAEKSVRAQYTRRRLLADELLHWPGAEHDAIDAIGIGLKYLGRFEPRTVFVDDKGMVIR